jgi:uncharacterized coiled-coil protein SlyX
MIERVRSWYRENHTLVFFLLGQLVAFLGILGSLIAYSVRLESRVSTLETRGSLQDEKQESRLTSLESQAKANKERIDRIVDAVTKK